MSDGYGRLEQRDHEALVRVLMLAFGGQSRDDTLKWAGSLGFDRWRVWREDGVVVGCAGLIEMGQFFGGRSVPMEGVAGVGVAPEVRGRGIATRLMRAIVLELAESGVPISTLFPATQPLYRRAGYEPAGHGFKTTIDVQRLGVRVNEPRARAATEGDREAIQACAGRVAADHDGNLDRGAYNWDRIFYSRGERREIPGLVVDGPRGIEGYIFYTMDAGSSLPIRGVGQLVRITDVAAETPAAARRLLSLLGELSSVSDEAMMKTGPMHPLLLIMPEHAFKCELLDHWMTRVVDVPTAVAARGYRRGIDAEVAVEIEDDLVASNHGVWTIRVRDGRAMAERGGRTRIRMNVRQFASVYTGFAAPKQLVRVGLVEGDDEALDTLGAIFAAPAPWMPDIF